MIPDASLSVLTPQNYQNFGRTVRYRSCAETLGYQGCQKARLATWAGKQHGFSVTAIEKQEQSWEIFNPFKARRLDRDGALDSAAGFFDRVDVQR